MKTVEVTVGGGAETIRVQADRAGITLTNGTRWRQALTREEGMAARRSDRRRRHVRSQGLTDVVDKPSW